VAQPHARCTSRIARRAAGLQLGRSRAAYYPPARHGYVDAWPTRESLRKCVARPLPERRWIADARCARSSLCEPAERGSRTRAPLSRARVCVGGLQAFLKRVVAVAGDVVEIGREVALPDSVLPATRPRQRESRPGPYRAWRGASTSLGVDPWRHRRGLARLIRRIRSRSSVLMIGRPDRCRLFHAQYVEIPADAIGRPSPAAPRAANAATLSTPSIGRPRTVGPSLPTAGAARGPSTRRVAAEARGSRAPTRGASEAKTIPSHRVMAREIANQSAECKLIASDAF